MAKQRKRAKSKKRNTRHQQPQNAAQTTQARTFLNAKSVIKQKQRELQALKEMRERFGARALCINGEYYSMFWISQPEGIRRTAKALERQKESSCQQS